MRTSIIAKIYFYYHYTLHYTGILSEVNLFHEYLQGFVRICKVNIFIVIIEHIQKSKTPKENLEKSFNGNSIELVISDFYQFREFENE